VPSPFDKEFTGGAGQVIHDKFIVIDFNDANPVVFTGSSNLADGGETQNGDNLLAFHDPAVARLFATEAIRLIDHYYFRAAVSKATSVKPLILTACGGDPKWWVNDYDVNSMRNVQRLLFADGPSAVTSVPAGVPDDAPAAPAKAAGKKASTKKTAPAKAAKKAPAKTAGKAKSVTKPKAPAQTKAKPKAKPKPKAKSKAPAKSAKKKTAAKERAPVKKAARKVAKPKPKPATKKTRRPAKKVAKKAARRAR
jgi:hypothetical protein